MVVIAAVVSAISLLVVLAILSRRWWHAVRLVGSVEGGSLGAASRVEPVFQSDMRLASTVLTDRRDG